MKHLEFTEKLKKLGCSFSSNNFENKTKTFEIPNFFMKSNFVEVKNFNVRYVPEDNVFKHPKPLNALITKAIDLDEWKHSLHNEIIPENFEKFKGIIQDKILNRAEDIDFLLTVYFQIDHELLKLQK